MRDSSDHVTDFMDSLVDGTIERLSPNDRHTVPDEGCWNWIYRVSSCSMLVCFGFALREVCVFVDSVEGVFIVLCAAMLPIIVACVIAAHWSTTLTWRLFGSRLGYGNLDSDKSVLSVASRTGAGLLRVGHWLGLLLPRRARIELYTPSHLDIVEDWLETRNQRARVQYWVLICIAVQIGLNFLGSMVRGVLAGLINVFRPGI